LVKCYTIVYYMLLKLLWAHYPLSFHHRVDDLRKTVKIICLKDWHGTVTAARAKGAAAHTGAPAKRTAAPTAHTDARLAVPAARTSARTKFGRCTPNFSVKVISHAALLIRP
jgi:hypothetical protein